MDSRPHPVRYETMLAYPEVQVPPWFKAGRWSAPSVFDQLPILYMMSGEVWSFFFFFPTRANTEDHEIVFLIREDRGWGAGLTIWADSSVIAGD